MTDRYAGFLVTLDKEMRSDDSECVIEAIKMIKYVQSVKPYLADTEKYMIAEREKFKFGERIIEMILKEERGIYK